MNKFERVEDPADPTRCQGIGGAGQCPFRAVPGSDFCPRHGANKQIEKQVAKSGRLYQLAKWATQLEQAADAPNIKSLREEIGLLRMLIQEKMNAAKDNSDLVMMSGSLSELIMKVTKAVQACQRIEKDLGQLLDKTQATALASQFVDVITKYIDDPDILQFVSEDLLSVVNNIDLLQQT